MNNPNMNRVSDNSVKDNFFVMYNNTNPVREKIKLSYLDKKRLGEFIEYTDDVAELVRALYEKINSNLEEYFLGSNTITDINKKMKNFYKLIKNYCLENYLFDEKNEAYKSKILKDIYRSYRYNTVITAVNINDSEGRKEALHFTTEKKESKSYYIYYNSKYYFACEVLRDELTKMINQLAEEEGVHFFDTESIDNRKRYIYDYGFNYAWFWNNKINYECGVDMNKSLTPPENIQVLYKEYSDTSRNSQLMITYENEKIELELQEKYRNKNENHSLFDILKSYNVKMADQTKVNEFLSSFYLSVQEER